jgi:vacuolar protein sorting-associated protein 72
LGLPTQAPHPPPNFYHHPNAQNPPPYVIAPPMLDGSAPVPGLGFGHGLQTPSPRPAHGASPFTKPPTLQPQNQHLNNAQTPAKNSPPPFGFPLGQHNYHQNVPNYNNTPPTAQNRPQYPPHMQYPPYRPLVQELPLEPPKPEPPAITNSAVNYLILQNFDETAIKDKNVQTEIILKRRFQKQSSSKL